jgi:cytochrome c oxidase cbb3-type subunit 1
VDDKAVRAHFIAGLVALFLGATGGLLYSLQLLGSHPWPGVELLSAGRVRMFHTNMLIFGWLVNGFIGGLNYVVPKLTDRPLASPKLTWLIFGAWQLVVLLTGAGILMGHAQGIEYSETPLFVDPLIILGVVLLSINLLTPILKARSDSYYVSIWYVSAALIWTALNYIMGTYLPQYVVPGTGGAAIVSTFIHNQVGLLVTPLGWGLLYYFVPAALKKPIYSHALSLVGFWSLAFFYPLNSVHHYLYSPIPMFIQYASVVASVCIHVVVYTVAYNFYATLRGRGSELLTNIPLRFFNLWITSYILTCLQCAVQVTLSAQQIIHFTDWVVGHAHLVLFGVFSFWLLGIMAYLWPKMYKRPLPWGWASAAFWLCAAGTLVMWVDLGAAGLVQGFLWRQASVPWIESVKASAPFWMARTLAGVGIFGGIVCMTVALYKTARPSAGRRSAAVEA